MSININFCDETYQIDINYDTTYNTIIEEIRLLLKLKDFKIDLNEDDPITDGMIINLEIPDKKEFCQECIKWCDAYDNKHYNCLSSHYLSEKHNINFSIAKDDNLEALKGILGDKYGEVYLYGLDFYSKGLETYFCRHNSYSILKHFREYMNYRIEQPMLYLHDMNLESLRIYFGTGYIHDYTIEQNRYNPHIIKYVIEKDDASMFKINSLILSEVTEQELIFLVEKGIGLYPLFFRYHELFKDKLKIILDMGKFIDEDIIKHAYRQNDMEIIKLLDSYGYKGDPICYYIALEKYNLEGVDLLFENGITMPKDALRSLIGECTYSEGWFDIDDDTGVRYWVREALCRQPLCDCEKRSDYTKSKEKNTIGIILHEASKSARADFKEYVDKKYFSTKLRNLVYEEHAHMFQ